MAAAALIALAHDMVITVGIYAWTGFEVSPATMIGFLTVLGYSLYDTVVVFDKVRENTTEAFANGRLSFAQAANLAVNQTMVRSINTTVIGLLPITAVLAVGAVFLGPGVLLDLSLVLFVGILIGAYSSIFIATPLLVTPAPARRGGRRARQEGRPLPGPQGQGRRGRRGGAGRRSSGRASRSPSAAAPRSAAEGEGATLTGRAVHKYAQPTPAGPRNQPRRTPKSKR